MFATTFLDVPALVSAYGTVTLPGSKSISNRVLLLAALSRGKTVVHDLLASDDTAVMLAALKQMGCSVEQAGQTAVIGGLGGQLVNAQGKLFMGNAGTAMRPLTAALALLGMNIVIIAVLLAWLDKGKLISPSSARVGPTDLERLRARGLDLSRRQLAAQRSPRSSPAASLSAVPVTTTLIAEGGD